MARLSTNDERRFRDIARLQNKAIRLLAEGSPTDEILDPIDFDPENPKTTFRCTAVFAYMSQADELADAIRVAGDKQRGARADAAE